MIVAAIIENDNEILLLKTPSSSGREIWSLPFCVTSNDNYIARTELIEKCREYHVEIEINAFDIFCEYTNNGEKFVIFYSTLSSWRNTLPEDNLAVWFKTDSIISLSFEKRFHPLINKLVLEYERLASTKKSLKKVAKKISNIFDIDINIYEEKKAIKIFIKYSCDIFCPFVFKFYFDFEDDNRVRFIDSIHIAPSYVEGDKTDLYVLFANCMAIIQKLFWQEKVCIGYSRLFEVEINSASIIFNKQNNYCSIENVEEKFYTLYFDFLTSLFVFGSVFGTFKTKLDATKFSIKHKKYLYYDHLKCNCQARKDVQFYHDANKRLSLICIDNAEYDGTFFSKLKWEVVDGIDGKILCQINALEERQSFNFVSNDCWNTINDVIKEMGISNYTFVCQNNCLYMLEGQNIWIFENQFCEYWLEKEKQKLHDRQQRENIILNFNITFKWRFPINYGRFEELIADLIETEDMIEKVRLVGKPNCPDGGRDLLIWKWYESGKKYMKTRSIIGQCKAYKRSIRKSDVTDIRDMLENYDAAGFYLFTSSVLTAPLIDHLQKLRKKFDVDWWTEKEIFKKLRENSFIANRYTDILEIVDQPKKEIPLNKELA